MSKYSILLLNIVLVVSCSDGVSTSKPFSGPEFQWQICVDTSEWGYDDTLQSFDFYQAREAPSFLYSKVDPGFGLSTLLSIPVHGGGLKISHGDTVATVLAYPDQIAWQLNEQSGSVPIKVGDYPLELEVEVGEDEIALFAKLKHQSRLSLGKLGVRC